MDFNNDKKLTVDEVVYRLWRDLDRLSTGEIADLRRMTPDRSFSPCYWKFIMLRLVPNKQINLKAAYREMQEINWAIIISCIAQMRDLWDTKTSFGTALAMADFNENRLDRLLRAKTDQLTGYVFTATKFMVAKGVSANLNQLAHLILSDKSNKKEYWENTRRNIARDYYYKKSIIQPK